MKKQLLKNIISKPIKVTGWITDGAPSAYGLLLENKSIVPLKKIEWQSLFKAWALLHRPSMQYDTFSGQIEFTKPS